MSLKVSVEFCTLLVIPEIYVRLNLRPNMSSRHPTEIPDTTGPFWNDIDNRTTLTIITAESEILHMSNLPSTIPVGYQYSGTRSLN